MAQEIQWIEREKTYSHVIPSGTEVRVKIVFKNKNKQHLRLTFYNDSEQKVTHTGRIVCGLALVGQPQIYLKEDDIKGYKIHSPKNGAKFVDLQVNHPLDPKDWEGCYPLTYDSIEKLWRVNTANRI